MNVGRLATCLVLAMLLSTPVAAQVKGFVESQNRLHPDPEASLLFFVGGPLTEAEGSWGWWAWAYVTRSYSNAYAGFSFRPSSWLKVGTAAGMESGENAYRIGSFLQAGIGRWHVLVLHEAGTTKQWWKVVGHADIGRFGVGIQSQAHCGIGPRIMVRLGRPSLRTTIWTAGLWDRERALTVQGGIQLGFK